MKNQSKKETVRLCIGIVSTSSQFRQESIYLSARMGQDKEVLHDRGVNTSNLFTTNGCQQQSTVIPLKYFRHQVRTTLVPNELNDLIDPLMMAF